MSLGIPIIAFVAGIIFGAVMLLFYASKMARTQPAGSIRSNSPDPYKVLRNRLELARQRFGQIANRESIGEARKLANQALKELT